MRPWSKKRLKETLNLFGRHALSRVRKTMHNRLLVSRFSSTLSVPPSGIACKALRERFQKTCLSCAASASAVTGVSANRFHL